MDQTLVAEGPELAKPVPRLIGHLHAFRAVTIVMIVAVHVGALLRFFNFDVAAGGTGIFVAAFILETLVHNATIFFALISGLLFAQVLETRGWGPFFRSKLKNVALPYVVVSALFVFTALDVLQGGYFAIFSGGPLDYVGQLVSDVLHREVQSNPILWYLPVLLIMFALTPLLVPMLRSRAGPFVLAALLLAPLAFSRTWPLFDWNNVIFFLAPYAAGIFFGTPSRYRSALEFVRTRMWLFVAVVIATTIATWFVLPENRDPVMWHGTNLFESVTYIHKMAAAPLVLLALHAFDEGMPRIVSRLADDSFAIYFLHMWPVVGWLWLIDTLWGRLTSPMLYFGLVLLGTFLTCALLLIVIGALRRVLGRWSRPLIGA